MQEILSNSELDHKFVRALRRIDPTAEVYRKSGSWSDYHSDSALVQRNGHSYIVVVLSHSADGAKWIERIVTKLDGLVVGSGSLATEQSLSWNPMH
jgi:beta-lactamase class A